jgi:hypothetical protein
VKSIRFTYGLISNPILALKLVFSSFISGVIVLATLFCIKYCSDIIFKTQINRNRVPVICENKVRCKNSVLINTDNIRNLRKIRLLLRGYTDKVTLCSDCESDLTYTSHKYTLITDLRLFIFLFLKSSDNLNKININYDNKNYIGRISYFNIHAVTKMIILILIITLISWILITSYNQIIKKLASDQVLEVIAFGIGYKTLHLSIWQISILHSFFALLPIIALFKYEVFNFNVLPEISYLELSIVITSILCVALSTYSNSSYFNLPKNYLIKYSSILFLLFGIFFCLITSPVITIFIANIPILGIATLFYNLNPVVHDLMIYFHLISNLILLCFITDYNPNLLRFISDNQLDNVDIKLVKSSTLNSELTF